MLTHHNAAYGEVHFLNLPEKLVLVYHILPVLVHNSRWNTSNNIVELRGV